ncbi:lytic transglycosylase domain-containing protein [Paenibacillus sp. GCM10023248]|uniref:lytic transglycosylase domain-containing protein n=1 Tax=Bacillales TaxID=1385 RepID=UPI002377F16A|nr:MULTISPECIES: lytic transglycosylase domain-containing protein [Bacillales]MDD9265813.1 lytic transglycosylase domain-containing protein [Paenibacillus sp. MAHUQ-63]MDR6879052.1 soluble lytic murein transglycosylase [Bacillus sp. 3255]
MKFLRKKRVFALLLICFIMVLFMNSSFIGRKLYPIYFQQEIKQSAAKHNIDPFLIAAIIRVETNYKYHLESSKGALGLMQLMPDTAEWIVESTNLGPHTQADLLKAEVNINLGSWYLSWLTRHYNGNLIYAIAAYNAGQGNVNKWKQNEIWDGTQEHIDQIPFGETRHYVQRVIYYYEKYTKLYSEQWET